MGSSLTAPGNATLTCTRSAGAVWPQLHSRRQPCHDDFYNSSTFLFCACATSDMESPNKRQKMQSENMSNQDDFVPLGGDDEVNGQYAYGAEHETHQPPGNAPTGPRERHTPNGHPGRQRNARHDPRNAKDRPKSKHILPGYEPWVLVRTKYGRRFAHNTETRESFWYIPKEVMPGVLEFERREKEDKEKDDNQRWAEEQLREMEAKSKAAKINKAADQEQGRNRRRRSESLQREDEEAFMAELAAQAEHAEEQDAKEAVQATEQQPQGPQAGDYASDSEYEYVEVTDTEGEEGEEEVEGGPSARPTTEQEQDEPEEEGPVEFGEDDIAYQLAAMGQDYGLDPGEYGDDQEEEWEDGAEGLPLSDEDAIGLFRDMLDDHRISPYTPWDKLIADESPDSILMDDRYTVLPTSRLRKEAWEAWTKDKAAQLREERARMEKLDPKIPYLAFLSEKATTKLYWPEFKRKFKREAEMNDRKLVDEDREKLYRDHINRLKLPESTRKADLVSLLKAQPLSVLNNSTSVDALPQQVLSHLHLISLPAGVRGPLVQKHIDSLPPAPDADEGEWSEEQRAAEEKKRAERRKREAALAEREKQVEEERRKAEFDERRAKRDLREEQAELARYARI